MRQPFFCMRYFMRLARCSIICAAMEMAISAGVSAEMEIPILLATFGPMRRGEIYALDSAHVSGNIVHVEFPDYVIDRIKNTKGPITTLNPAQISNRFV